MRPIHLLLCSLFALALTHTPSALAQDASKDALKDWPNKPLRYIVPFAPGGATDMLGRMVAQGLSKSLNQSVVVDNKAGQGGSVGSAELAKSKPDGYTLGGGTISSHALNVSLYPKLAYDPIKDFAPITMIAAAPLLVVVHPSLPVKTIGELIQYAKTRPGQINFASSGTGSIAHLAPEMLNSMAKISLTHIPYKGTAPALVDLLGGQVQVMMNSAVSMLPLVRNGKLRGIATTGARRLTTLPEMPTVAESGVTGYEAASWYGILAPAQTPRPVIDTLNREIVAIMRRPELRERLIADGAEPVGNTPEEFAAYIKRELPRWAAVIKAAGIRPD